MSGLNNQHLKHKNRGLILKLICTKKDISRIQLSQITGLTKMTVTNIISELIDRGYVKQSAESRNSGVGRNPITLTIANDAPKVLGINLGRDGCSAMLFDLKLRIINKAEEKFKNETQDTVIKKLLKTVDEVCGNEKNILGCGVSAIGPLDVSKGIVLNPPNFYGIENLHLKRILSKHFPFKVIVNNDMNSAALAEKLYGGGKDLHDFIYVGISNGIGSGIITDDRLYQKSSGFIGELGHISIDYNGKKCSCGRKGCLECYISLPVILEKLRKTTGLNLSFREFCENTDNENVNEIFTNMILKLSYGLVNQVNMLNPQAVFIGHEGTFLPEYYIELLKNEVNKNKFTKNYLNIEINKSSFGHYAPMYGSACIMLDYFFENGKMDLDYLS